MVRRAVDGIALPVLAFLWCVSLAISIYHLFAHDAPLLPTILGQWSLLVVSLAFGIVAYHVLQKGDSSRERNQISVHGIGMFGLAGLAAGGYATHQYLSPLTRLPIEGIVFQALFVALIGGAAGLYVGLGVARRDRHTDQLAAFNNLHEIALDVNRKLANETSRGEIEQAVCDRLTSSDSYEFAWVGTVDDRTQEVVPSTTADASGHFENLVRAVDDGNPDRSPTGAALRTGDPQIVRDIEDIAANGHLRDRAREQVREHGIRCLATVPIAYEEQSYGTLTVYTTRANAFDGVERKVVRQLGELMGLAIAAVEREQQVAHERERLEFVNRLIRHNLLNGLNVIRARSRILEPHVDSAGQEHLHIVRERTDDMVDLIQTLRSLMQVLVLDEPHELEPVSLRRVLRAEIEKVRQTFDHVEFDVRGDLDEAGPVMADDLLGKVFGNLLVNAVQHNDEEITRITIDVETEEDQVIVRIADNGPGVPDDLRDRVFEKGEKSFTSPGTGFGLYLVREIVESYGGTITVENVEPKGAMFSTTLHRADR